MPDQANGEAITSNPGTLLLLIHGVGDAPCEKTCLRLDRQLGERLDTDRITTLWYDWNEAIESLVEAPESFERLGMAICQTARLGLGATAGKSGHLSRLLRICRTLYRTDSL